MSTATMSATSVQEFRSRTGLPLMEAKRLLVEAEGDQDKAAKLAQAQGLQPDDRSASERPGYVGSYLHHNGQFGAMVVLRSSSDTLAKTREFRELADSLALHVAVSNPTYIDRGAIPDGLSRSLEDEVAQECAAMTVGKNPEIITRILKGKMEMIYQKVCLLDQPFVKEDKISVAALINDLARRSRETIGISGFHRFSL